ncbi:MAG TPA: YmaF family protein [Candidatus Atribacteria bacterium]|nr:YmaF family protein [Candidatus Atribacteria bacterium]
MYGSYDIYGRYYDEYSQYESCGWHDDCKRMHTHALAGTTSCVDGHVHHYATVTKPAPSGVKHTHLFECVTTLNDGHVHKYYHETGPAIETKNGHYHEYKLKTEYADWHTHKMCEKTSVD